MPSWITSPAIGKPFSEKRKDKMTDQTRKITIGIINVYPIGSRYAETERILSAYNLDLQKAGDSDHFYEFIYSDPDIFARDKDLLSDPETCKDIFEVSHQVFCKEFKEGHAIYNIPDAIGSRAVELESGSYIYYDRTHGQFGSEGHITDRAHVWLIDSKSEQDLERLLQIALNDSVAAGATTVNIDCKNEQIKTFAFSLLKKGKLGSPIREDEHFGHIEFEIIHPSLSPGQEDEGLAP